MKLFTVGPTQMRKEILDVRHQQVPYFRTTEFSEVMLDSDRLLKKFMNAPESYKSIYLTRSEEHTSELRHITRSRMPSSA